MNIGHLDENGLYNGEFTPVAVAGTVRIAVSRITMFYRR